MEIAEKIMVACLLISEGADDETVSEFISVLSDGVEAGEEDAITLFNQLMERMEGDVQKGYFGDVIRLMKSKIKLDESYRKFGMAITGMEKVMKILDENPKNDFAAKIMVQRALDAIAQTCKKVN